MLFGLCVGLITCRNNTSFLHASVYVNKHWRHMNHTKTFSPANASGFEYILPFEGLTTHGTSQEQLLTNNSRCRQTLNTMLYSVLGLFMLTFANPFYCFLRSGPLLCSFKIYILGTLKIHTQTLKLLLLIALFFSPFGAGKLKALCCYCDCPCNKNCRICGVGRAIGHTSNEYWSVLCCI